MTRLVGGHARHQCAHYAGASAAAAEIERQRRMKTRLPDGIGYTIVAELTRARQR
jgi:hypothetical protein